MPRIYLDNAATSYPNPESVYAAVDHYNRTLGAAAGRGGYRAAIEVELLKRPINGRNPASAVNRNWEPGETVATLKQQNTDHGIGD